MQVERRTTVESSFRSQSVIGENKHSRFYALLSEIMGASRKIFLRHHNAYSSHLPSIVFYYTMMTDNGIHQIQGRYVLIVSRPLLQTALTLPHSGDRLWGETFRPAKN
jgi:hypothetical protein